MAITESLIGTIYKKDDHSDPYWEESAKAVLQALIHLEMENAAYSGRQPSFGHVIQLLSSFEFIHEDELSTTSLDSLFDELEAVNPESPGCELWKTITNMPPRTAACIMGVIRSLTKQLFLTNILAMMRMEKKIDFEILGKEKSILFIRTSPVNKSLQNVVNLMYSDLFRVLFDAAERREEGRLEVPVHVICDDFACGSRINNFEEYISVFRAAGISATLLLQSESQLSGIYGTDGAATIINNCGTYVYMGGMDHQTCQNLAYKCDRSERSIISLPAEYVLVLQAGREPVEKRRYQTLKDPLYQEMMQMKGAAAREKECS